MMSEGYELAFVIGGLFLSLSAFSLILGDNYLFRLGTSIVSGAISAYICVLLAESYFYPLILDIINGRNTLSVAQIIRAVLVIIGIIFLFTKAYSGSRTGGKVVLMLLMGASAAVLLLGAAGGTVPSMIRSLSGMFRVAVLSNAERSDAWHWIKNITILVSAVGALLYTRHYDLSSKPSAVKKGGSVAGDILVGFTFGAISAAVFSTAANILVNHISELVSMIQSLAK